MSVAATPVLGNAEYFQQQAKKLGEEVDESDYEPTSPKKKNHDDQRHDDQRHVDDLGESDLEAETYAKPVNDDIMGDNEVGALEDGK